jgi:putative spermidine/putrescine transport system ATP-binding protein
VSGQDITASAANKRNMGVVFQEYALFPHMTAADNVGYGLRVRKRPHSEIQDTVERLLALVRLEDHAHKLPRHLSGGEQQRVAVARALAINPTMLLLDEPLSNLDARLRLEVGAELRRIQRDTGITTLMVTHDQEEAFALADRIAVMRDGHIEQVGTPEELYDKPSSSFVAGFIGKVNWLQCVVVSMSPLVVECEGIQFELANDDSQRIDLERGDRCGVVVRPESIRVTDSCAGSRCFEGTLKDRVFGGAFTRIEVKTKDHTLEVQTNDRFAGAAGSVLHLTWPTSAARAVRKG